VSSSICADSVAIVSSRKSICASICPTSSAWWPLKRPLQRFAQRGDLLTQPALGKLGEDLGVVGAADQRVEHQARRLAEDLRGDRGELDLGLLQGLRDALDLAAALLDLGLAVADEIAQLALRARRNETRADQAVLEQLAAPLGVLNVALATGDVT
jgi:hypothetical protein